MDIRCLRFWPLKWASVLCLLALTACGPATLPPGDSIVDRDEVQNRANHQFNIALDRTLIGPVANTYGTVLPEPVRDGVDNFASNLNQPSYVLNNLLQFRLGHAVENTLRFVVNSTVGIGGLFDPATAIGIPARETDFGETLHIYGVPEGDYQVLPVLGPSTTRDTVGLIVDIATNPVRVVLNAPENDYVFGAEVADRFGDRFELGATLDEIFNNSPDSYTTLRSLYLQNRRFELGGADLSLEDPFGDPFFDAAVADDPNADPLNDQYFDPYDQ